MLEIDFQDGHSGGHLGLSIDTILAIFDLKVILLLQCKFQLKSAYGLIEVKNWFSSYYYQVIINKLALLHIECYLRVIYIIKIIIMKEKNHKCAAQNYRCAGLSISKLNLFTAANKRGPYHSRRMRMLIHIFVISPNHRCAGMSIS